MASKPIMNVEDVEPISFGDGGRFEGEFRWISREIGAQKLGYNHVVLAPGKTAFPYHYHRGNEEAFFILVGSGLLRYGGEEFPLRAGDAIAYPTGSGSAHQITNNSDAELKYLAPAPNRVPRLRIIPTRTRSASWTTPILMLSRAHHRFA